MEKKTVIVTGGTRGIGLAIVKKLLADGCYVIYTGTSEQGVRIAEESLANADAEGFDLDLTHPAYAEGRSRQLQGLLERRRHLHGLVNNAGICRTEHLRRTREESDCWGDVIAVNLTGPMRVTRALAPYLTRDASVVNIASQLGMVGRAGYGAYCASKHGLIGLTKVWAKELAPVRVNAVCPGWIETEMTAKDLRHLAAKAGEDPTKYRERVMGGLDLGRMNTPEEVAAIVAFLLSGDASGITGRVIEMAGPSA